MATDTQVLVVGAGPVGLFMAAELNRHGISCRIVDKNDEPTHASRAASIQARTLEILDTISLADEFVQVGNLTASRIEPRPSTCGDFRQKQSILQSLKRRAITGFLQFVTQSYYRSRKYRALIEKAKIWR